MGSHGISLRVRHVFRNDWKSFSEFKNITTPSHPSIIAFREQWDYTHNQVVLGSHRHSETNTYEIVRDIIEKIDHPEYGYHMGMLPHDDILLLKLSEPVEMSEGVSPACLAPEGDYTGGRHCYVSGWGTLYCKFNSTHLRIILEYDNTTCTLHKSRLPDLNKNNPVLQTQSGGHLKIDHKDGPR